MCVLLVFVGVPVGCLCVCSLCLFFCVVSFVGVSCVCSLCFFVGGCFARVCVVFVVLVFVYGVCCCFVVLFRRILLWVLRLFVFV